MSRFFSDIEDEKKEIRKSFIAPHKQVEKMSKKNKLLNDLQLKIEELEKNTKNIKKFLSDLKKYDTLQLPDFLKEFLLGKLVYTKGNKKVIDEYITKFNTEEGDISILENDTSIVEDSINKNSIKSDTPTNIAACISLLMKHTKNKNVKEMYNTLQILLNHINNNRVQTCLIKHYDIFYELDREYFINTGLYIKILENIKKVDYKFYERRMLYLYLKEDIKQFNVYMQSSYNKKYLSDFCLLDCILRNDKDNACNILKSINNINKDTLYIENIYKCGEYFFSNKMYYESFICYSLIYENNICRIELYVLCVILNHRVKDHRIFKDFLNLVVQNNKSNIFGLQSGDSINEICRGFVLLHDYDIDSCYRILNGVLPSFTDRNVLYN